MINKHFINRKVSKINSIDWNTLFNTFPNPSKPESPSLYSLSLWRNCELNFISEYIDEIEELLQLKCRCSKGCSHCCKQAIYIDPAEYEILKYSIKSLNFSDTKTLKSLAHSICDKLKSTTIPFSLTAQLSADEQLEINKNYFSLNLNCPFLDSNNCCIIYKQRPLVCLTFRNYGKSNTCNPKYAYSYTQFDLFTTTRIYENSYVFLKQSSFTLLPYALTQIL